MKTFKFTWFKLPIPLDLRKKKHDFRLGLTWSYSKNIPYEYTAAYFVPPWNKFERVEITTNAMY